MKKILMLVSILLTISNLYGYSFTLTNSGINFNSSFFELDFKRNSGSFRLGNLQFGGMETSGLIKHLASPHSEFDFMPKANAKAKENTINGTVYFQNEIGLFTTTSIRPGIGLYYGKNTIEAFAYYANQGKEKDKVQGKFQYIGNTNALYLGIKLNYLKYKALISTSFLFEGILDSFVSLTYEDGFNSFRLSVGDIAPLGNRKDKTSLSGSYKNEGNQHDITLQFELGTRPIYSEECLSFKFMENLKFSILGIELESSATIERNSKGKMSEERKYKLHWNFISVKYSLIEGLAVLLESNGVSINYSKNKLNVSYRFIFKYSSVETEISVGNIAGLAVKIKIGE